MTTAERLNLALLQRATTCSSTGGSSAGLEYDQAIAAAIAASDLIVFLITPASVAAGRYTLTEIKLAEERWPRPSGRVLPVMMRATEIAAVPSYLRAVNILTPRGEAVAETAHEVQRLTRGLRLTTRVGRWLRSPVGLVAAALIVAASAFSSVARPWRTGSQGDEASRCRRKCVGARARWSQ